MAVAVALYPDDFAGGAVAADGSGWDVLGTYYPTNPRLLLDDEAHAMLTVWIACRSSGFGPGHLPGPGGAADQSALMMDCLAIMNGAEAKLRKARGEDQ